PDGPNVLVCQSAAIGQIHPDWMPRSGFAADALTGASIIASPPPGQIKMQSLQKKPCCDPMHQTEAAVMNEAWGPDLSSVQWPDVLLWTCCWESGTGPEKMILCEVTRVLL
ncbi:Phosphate acyltransferase, partial [Dissostichus eleginoides]